MNKTIIFTGGGTAGHVTPNLEIIPFFISNGWNVFYIGSKNGMEREIVFKSGTRIKFLPIHAGKLRRYFSLQNIGDIFLIGLGVIEAFIIIKKYKPAIVFSKGGFVSFPVVFAAWLNRIHVLIHESDVTPGLSNKLSEIFSSKIFSTFPETEKYISNDKLEYIGPIIRSSFKMVDSRKGYKYCGLNEKRPVILVIGGSLGSESINKAIKKDLNKLVNDFQIVHICGKGNIDESIKFDNYRQFEFIGEQFPNVLAMSQMVVARAGSNSIFEFLFMKKPMILIPLPLKSSRGDQILNAKIFKDKGYCEVINDEDLENVSLENVIRMIYSNKDHYINNMQDINFSDNAKKVYKFIIKRYRSDIV
ncbi:MAG TPA: undecaprenyldiphospho-muramoylpentapeptide beta-N-acetylglucosaminyltransferase [Candidatus Staskawiczbacteria bacterium]|nr:undecaprenyldiphospho-muramoylpentapeptide beta-N-acetylglucosaminyltransferase [Candidatus Staskawiczbacteria bacterium]